MRRFGTTAISILVAVLALAACGAERGEGADAVARDEATSTTAATRTTAASGASSRAAFSVAFSDEYVLIDHDDRCLSGRAVDIIGVDRLNEAGISPGAFAQGAIFPALEIDEEEQAAIAADLAVAMEECHNAERIATDWLTDEDDTWDLTEFAPCMETPLIPELTTIVMDGWAGERTGTLDDAFDQALAVGDAGCPEIQVEVAAIIASDAGRELTPEERACALEVYQGFADEHRELDEDDDATVARTCFEG